MTPVQAKLYSQTLQRSKKLLAEMDDTTLEAEANAGDDEKPSGAMTNSKAKSKAADKKKGPSSSSSSNILMDLRKAASHPLLFRRLYTDAKVKAIAKECLRTSRWCDSNFDYVVEDLEVSSSSRLAAIELTWADHERCRAPSLLRRVGVPGKYSLVRMRRVDHRSEYQKARPITRGVPRGRQGQCSSQTHRTV